MDLVTAALLALKSFNDFLCTPAGQKLADFNANFIVMILTKLHLKIMPDVAASVQVPATKT